MCLRVALPLVLLLGSVAPAHADAPAPDSWKLLYTQDGLRVYRDDSHALPAFKAEGFIDANIFELMAVLSDIGKRTEWVRDLQETRILAGDVESKVTIYEQYHLPWPCQNRDSVVESTIQKNLHRLEVAVDYHQVTSDKAPPRAGVVRMPVVRGNMLFRYVDKGRSYAQVILTLDVGGSLPTWAVNRFVRGAPVLTLQGLVRQVKTTRGKYDAFIRTHEAEARQQAEIPFELAVPLDAAPAKP